MRPFQVLSLFRGSYKMSSLKSKIHNFYENLQSITYQWNYAAHTEGWELTCPPLRLLAPQSCTCSNSLHQLMSLAQVLQIRILRIRIWTQAFLADPESASRSVIWICDILGRISTLDYGSGFGSGSGTSSGSCSLAQRLLRCQQKICFFAYYLPNLHQSSNITSH